MEEFAVGQVVNYTFETKPRSGGRTNNYATGEIVKVGKRLSVKITDGHDQRHFWRDAYIGKVKVIDPRRVYEPLK